jgi:hypothetical protein
MEARGSAQEGAPLELALPPLPYAADRERLPLLDEHVKAAKELKALESIEVGGGGGYEI